MIDLEKLDALCEAATSGPWERDGHQGRPWTVTINGGTTFDEYHGHEIHVIQGCNRNAHGPLTRELKNQFDGVPDAAFIAAARQAVPELVAEVRRLRKSLDDLQAACMQGIKNMRTLEDAKT